MLNPAVPKLLAKENIDVVYGNYETAFFDVQNRKLGMPVRAEQDKDIESLFYLHEVGHALHTPEDGWHDSVIDLGIPRDILNIVEDARIEKLVLREYPGAVSCFHRGYEKLQGKKFFGEINDEVVAEMGFLDRLNIKCKLRNLINVKFEAEELVLYKRALTLETWQDVVDLSKDIMALIDTQNPQEPPENSFEDEDQDPVESAPMESSESDLENDEITMPNMEEVDPELVDKVKEILEEMRQETQSRSVKSEEEVRDIYQSSTDREFRQKEYELNNELNTKDSVCTSTITAKQTFNAINSREKLVARRISYGADRQMEDAIKYWPELSEDAYYEYMKRVKRNVQYAVKEFELRKNAFQQTRAMVKDTGVLDVNKLHSYKYNDNIFSQMTNLAQFKNHGIVMLLDWSGSMVGCLSAVIDQLLHMTAFCKKINIPFEVYSFTSGQQNERAGTMNFNVQYNELLTSHMSKSEFEEACYWLYVMRNGQVRYNITSDLDSMGGTPLREALFMTDHVIARFKSRTRVNKVNFVCLTDGDANGFQFDNAHYGYEKAILMHEGDRLEFQECYYSRDVIASTKTILDYIKKKHNTTNVGFFVADSRRNLHYRVALAEMFGSFPTNTPRSGSDYSMLDTHIQKEKSALNKKLRKDNVIELQNKLGYDNYFVTLESQLKIEDEEELAVESNEKRDVLKAFKKHQSDRKSNKVLMGKVGKAFA